MKRLPNASRIAACLIALGAAEAAPLPAWRSLASDAFLVLYPAAREAEALEALAVLEQQRPYVQSITGARTRPVTVAIQDLGIESNGLTDTTFHRILLFPTAPGQGDLAFHESWWRLVGVHEYTHWQHLSARSGLPGLVVAAAGTWAAPASCTPSWLKEGVCVYAESGLSPLEGRLNEGTYEAILGALAREGRLPSLVEATFQPLAFPGPGVSVRLLGGSFFAYLARTYGPQSLPEFFRHFAAAGWSYLSPLLPWAGVDRSARRVFGKGMKELWLDWQLDLIERHAPGVPSAPAPAAAAQASWRAGDLVTWDGALYYQRQRPVKPAAFGTQWLYQLVRRDPAAAGAEVLYSTTAPFHGPLRLREGTLYFAVQELRPGYANREFASYGYEAVLYALDLQQPRRTARAILRGAFRSFEVLPAGTVLLSCDRSGAFGSDIQILGAGARHPRPFMRSDWRVEELLHDGEGWLYLSARARGANSGLYRVPLSAQQAGALGAAAAQRTPELPLEPVLDTPYAEGDISLAGELLLFSANWDGRHALYAWRAGDRGVARLSGGEHFAVAPALLDGQLYFTGLEASGYGVRSRPLALEPAVLPAQPAAPSPPPGAVPLAPATEPRRGRAGYLRNLGTLLPRALIPVFGWDAPAGTWQAGAVLAGRSALGDIFYAAGAYYDSAGGQPELTVSLQTQALPPLELSVSWATAGEDELEAVLEVPLYRSLRPGLSRISLGVAGSIFEDDYSRRTLEPLLRVGLQAPGGTLQSAVSLSLESPALGSAEEDLALLAALQWRQLLFGARIGLYGVGLHDFSGGLWRLPAPRGYAQGLLAGTGGFLSAELSLPLLRIRRGLWNPAVFFEDLFLVPFFDLAAQQSAQLQCSAGAALHLELRALAQDEGLPLEVSLGLVVTREGQGGVLLGLQMPLGAGGYAADTRSGCGVGWAALPPRPRSR